jgi:uncharacterized protein (DUF924 family)
MSSYLPILKFWFGPLDSHGRADAEHRSRWFTSDPAFDQLLRERFGDEHARVAAGQRDDWLSEAKGRLAYIIVLDQFSRNMFRGTARMFAFDSLALAAARQGLELGVDRQLGLDERSFFYMPFMHAEDLAAQDQCVDLFSGLLAELPAELKESSASGVDFARRHRDIVKRFGRFPHRNALLGRTTTAEEAQFLTQPGSSF